LEEISTHIALIDHGRVLFEGSRERLRQEGFRRCRVTVESLEPRETLLRALRETEGLTVEEDLEDGVSVLVPSEPEAAHRILARLVGRGIRVVSFARSHETLE